jgi:hypothetical protein
MPFSPSESQRLDGLLSQIAHDLSIPEFMKRVDRGATQIEFLRDRAQDVVEEKSSGDSSSSKERGRGGDPARGFFASRHHECRAHSID